MKYIYLYFTIKLLRKTFQLINEKYKIIIIIIIKITKIIIIILKKKENISI